MYRILATAKVPALAKPISFYATASYPGSRNYSRHDIAAAVKTGLLERYRWNPAERSDHTQIDIRVLLEETEAAIGVRLQAWPLHRRSYKTCIIPHSFPMPPPFCKPYSILATISASISSRLR